MVLLKRENGNYCGIVWKIGKTGEDEEPEEIELSLPVQGEEYTFLTKTVDEETCNPLKIWHDLGEPAHLDREQRKLLREAAKPFLASARLTAMEGRLSAKLHVRVNGVVYFELKESRLVSDRGYDYERVVAERA